MDSDLVSDLLSSVEGCGGKETSTPLFTYTDIFNEEFPFYLSIGMTYEQFWEGDPQLTVFYRKAYEMMLDRKNMELWLQGAYIYDAIARLIPVLQAFPKKGARAEEYVSEPYPLSKKQSEKQQEKKEKQKYLDGKAKMEAIMTEINSKFERK